MAATSDEPNAQSKPVPFRAAKILAGITGIIAMIGVSMPPLLLVAGILCLVTILVAIVTAVARLRFSLRTMVLVILWGGLCATLLTKIQQPALFSLGIVGTLILVAFVVSSIARANIPSERLDK